MLKVDPKGSFPLQKNKNIPSLVKREENGSGQFWASVSRDFLSCSLPDFGAQRTLRAGQAPSIPVHEERENWDIDSLPLWQLSFYFTRKAMDASQICQKKGEMENPYPGQHPGKARKSQWVTPHIKKSWIFLIWGIFLI